MTFREMRVPHMTDKDREGMHHHHDHDCDCGHEHDDDLDFEEDDIFLVTDEEGNERELVMVYSFDVDDRAYAVLIDRNDPESDGFIFRIEEENDEAFLADIEDEQEWEKVAAVYNQLMED